MPLVIGTPLPSKYYKKIIDPYCARYTRKNCPSCGNHWYGAEIPLADRWEGAAELCPLHGKKAVARHVTSIDQMKHTPRVRRAFLLTASFGGVYRRRICKWCASCTHHQGFHKPRCTLPSERWGASCPTHCEEFVLCTNPKTGKPMRWSTVELAIEGVVVEDIRYCRRCYTLGEPVRLDKKRARHTAEDIEVLVGRFVKLNPRDRAANLGGGRGSPRPEQTDPDV